MSKFHQPIEAGRAIFASVLCLPAKALAAAGLLSVVLLAPAAQAAATITDVKAGQRYPWNGKVDIEYTVSGLETAAKVKGVSPMLTVMAIDRTTTPWTTNVADLACLSIGPTGTEAFTDAKATADGAHHLVWNLDAQKLKLVSTNVVFAVMGEDDVQLWANGPFWSQCNVGATKPEEYGYYFWWGDTVGYTANTNNATWQDDCWEGVKWVSSTGTQMESSPFNSNVDTHGKTITQLQSAYYVDSSTNLFANYDAATAHLGAPWRMPTDAEFSALIDNCNMEEKTQSGVKGLLVKGREAYASRSIFLPAAGSGYDSGLYGPGSYGLYWSSTPYSVNSYGAWYLYFYSGDFYRYSYGYRYFGRSVRPLRGFAK